MEWPGLGGTTTDTDTIPHAHHTSSDTSSEEFSQRHWEQRIKLRDSGGKREHKELDALRGAALTNRSRDQERPQGPGGVGGGSFDKQQWRQPQPSEQPLPVSPQPPGVLPPDYNPWRQPRDEPPHQPHSSPNHQHSKRHQPQSNSRQQHSPDDVDDQRWGNDDDLDARPISRRWSLRGSQEDLPPPPLPPSLLLRSRDSQSEPMPPPELHHQEQQQQPLSEPGSENDHIERQQWIELQQQQQLQHEAAPQAEPQQGQEQLPQKSSPVGGHRLMQQHVEAELQQRLESMLQQRGSSSMPARARDDQPPRQQQQSEHSPSAHPQVASKQPQGFDRGGVQHSGSMPAQQRGVQGEQPGLQRPQQPQQAQEADQSGQEWGQPPQLGRFWSVKHAQAPETPKTAVDDDDLQQPPQQSGHSAEIEATRPPTGSWVYRDGGWQAARPQQGGGFLSNRWRFGWGSGAEP